MPERIKARDDRPRKPYPDFPLFPHRNGCWAKKIRGRFVFFGPRADAEGALGRYLEQRHALHAGLVPRAASPAPFAARCASGRSLGIPVDGDDQYGSYQPSSTRIGEVGRVRAALNQPGYRHGVAWPLHPRLFSGVPGQGGIVPTKNGPSFFPILSAALPE